MSTATLDPKEIAKFTELAAYWWDQEGPLRTLHDINPIRLQFIQAHARLANAQVIDVGCGGGILTEALYQAGAKIIGIDMDHAALETAQQHADAQQFTIAYKNIAVEEIAETHAKQFDIVTCMEMLEHTPTPQTIIQACAELLRPGGKLFVSTLNRHPKAYVMAIAGAEYLLNLLPRGTHDYQKFIKPSELAAFARNADLKLQALTGVSYNPLNRQCHLTKDINVNYMCCFVKDI